MNRKVKAVCAALCFSLASIGGGAATAEINEVRSIFLRDSTSGGELGPVFESLRQLARGGVSMELWQLEAGGAGSQGAVSEGSNGTLLTSSTGTPGSTSSVLAQALSAPWDEQRDSGQRRLLVWIEGSPALEGLEESLSELILLSKQANVSVSLLSSTEIPDISLLSLASLTGGSVK